MATFKLTHKRGGKKHDIVRANGSAIGGSDAVELNVDVTNMNKFDVLQALKNFEAFIVTKGFPL